MGKEENEEELADSDGVFVDSDGNLCAKMVWNLTP